MKTCRQCQYFFPKNGWCGRFKQHPAARTAATCPGYVKLALLMVADILGRLSRKVLKNSSAGDVGNP
jgi:hypothetical protein